MKFSLIFLFVLFLNNFLEAQDLKKLYVLKQGSTRQKCIKLPAKARLLTKDFETLRIKIDSISNQYVFYNGGKDSISLFNVRSVNLFWQKELIKYTAFTASSAITLAAAAFTIYSINYPVVIDGDNSIYKYVGMGYTAFFGNLSWVFFSFPRTRFKTKKYVFITK